MSNNEHIFIGTSTKYDRILRSFGIEKITKKGYEEGLEVYKSNFHDFVEWIEETELEDLGGLEFTEGIRKAHNIDHDLLEKEPDTYYENLEIYAAHLEVSLYKILRDSGKLEEFKSNGYQVRVL